MIRNLCAVALMIAQLLFTVPARARPFTARDLASLERVSSPVISPDARYAAYVLRTTDWQANKGVNSLQLVDLKDGSAQPLALLSREERAPNPRWAPDGQWIYFISGKSGSAQVWRSTPDGVTKQQLTAFPVDVAAFKVGPSGQTLIVAADVYPDCATLSCTKERDDAKAKGGAIEVDTGEARWWDAHVDEKFLSLFRVGVGGPGAPAEARPIIRGFKADVPGDADMDSVAVGKGERTLYFTSYDPALDRGGQAFPKIYAVPIDGANPPDALVDRPGTAISSPAISPDGGQLAYLAVTAPLRTPARTAIMVMDLGSNRTREIAPASDLALDKLTWAPDGRSLLAIGEEKGQTPLYRVHPVNGEVTKISSNGVVSGFDSGKDDIVFVRESLDSPQQLFVQNAGGPALQLTRAGASVLGAVQLSASEQFSFPGWKGEKVYGYVTKPYGFIEGRKYPVAFLIHGGPHGSFNNAWSYRWNPQVWAGMGYAVVSVDFHGSIGYGEKFARSLVGHWGDRPLEDLRKGWAFALSHYPYLDGDRACALGGSYGGYMIEWMASQWNAPWKCLVSHAGTFDLRSQAWVMDVGSFIDVQFVSSGTGADWERFNPVRFVDGWKKPLLVIHGGRDFRVPTEQAIAAYNAARRAGVPSELVIFPDENHWILKPQNSVQWYDVVQKWLDRWTTAVPGHPPAAE